MDSAHELTAKLEDVLPKVSQIKPTVEAQGAGNSAVILPAQLYVNGAAKEFCLQVFSANETEALIFLTERKKIGDGATKSPLVDLAAADQNGTEESQIIQIKSTNDLNGDAPEDPTLQLLNNTSLNCPHCLRQPTKNSTHFFAMTNKDQSVNVPVES